MTESPEPLQPWTNLGASARPQSLTAVASPTVTPNDPQYSSQWNLEKISAPQAWAVTTGSTNVVVAVIDTGVNYKHEDLVANMWRNPGETGLDANGNDKATNGIDDDGNGYVDDVYGIDARTHSGDPIDTGGSLGFHGTGLAGVIGAVGNNGTGIAGINWTVKLMALAFHDGTMAEFLEAVDYVIAMKRRGVNVRVISNSQYGGGNRRPLKDAVNAAGNEGILTVFDASNNGYNNDVFSFDSPNSRWSISVTGSYFSDELLSYSDYGRSTVDLAAPLGVPSTSEGSTTFRPFQALRPPSRMWRAPLRFWRPRNPKPPGWRSRPPYGTEWTSAPL
ncbi:MAG: S8 family serine peptidase [Verrucomicrobiota bacterium]